MVRDSNNEVNARLDLLPEQELDGIVLFLDKGEDGFVNRLEHLGRKWAHIVEIELQCV